MVNKCSLENFKNVLIIGFTGIGNMVLFSPVLRRLKKEKPSLTITLLTITKNRELDILIENGLVDNIIFYSQAINPSIINSLESYFNLCCLIYTIRRQHYDLSIFPFGGGSGKWKYELLSYFLGAKYRFIHSQSKNILRKKLNTLVPIKIIHDIEQNLQMLTFLGLIKEYPMFFITVNVERKNWANKLLAKNNNVIRIGLQPGAKKSFDASRIWPKEHFVKLCNNLHCRGDIKIFIFGIHNELEILNFIKEKSNANIQLIVDEPLINVAALIQQMACFIANDSSLMHIAAAVSTPTIGIFGPTNYVRTSPFGVKIRVVKSGQPIDKKYLLPGQKTNQNNLSTLKSLLPQVVVEQVIELLYDDTRQTENNA